MFCLLDAAMQSCSPYEQSFPMQYPWNDSRREDVPRFFRKENGWWEDPTAAKNGKALLSCVGDLICEPRLTRANRYGDTVFFHPLFQYVRPILRQSDFVIGNLETTVSDLTPDAGQFHTVAGKYHCNTRESLLDALRYAGFDAVVNANNHNCDSGVLGLMETDRRLDRHGFARTGTFLPGENDRAMLVEINGIRVGILSYATYFNRQEGNFTPEGRKMLNPFSPETAQTDVAWAKEKGAEFILCYIHWGKEYQHYPTELQTEQAQALADAGVDYIVGSHSHCLQISDQITAKSGKIVPLVYSMGNFITNERKDLCRHSGILQLLLEKTETGIGLRQWFVPCYIYDAFETVRFGPVPAGNFLTGAYDHPEQQRTQAFSQELIPLPQPDYCGITTAELCKLFGVPPLEQDFVVGGLCTQAAKIREWQVYFMSGSETDYEKLCLSRRRPILLVAEKEEADHLTLVVPDVRKAFAQLTSYLHSRFSGKTLTVAGSENKTVTAELIEKTLQQGFRVCRQDWQWHPSHQWWVREQRKSALGCEAVPSDICVLTASVEALPPMKENGIIFYNGADAALAEMLQDHPQAKPFAPVAFPGLRMELAAGAAAAVADHLGLAPIQNHSYSGMEQNIFAVRDMTVLTDYACKSEGSAKASLAALTAYPGKTIAVVEDRFAPFAKADKVISVPQPSEDRAERNAAELALEQEIIAQLEPGCALLFCGGRHLALNLTLRRIFGLTDGDIYDVT